MLKRPNSLVVCAFLVILASGSAAAPPSEGYVPVDGGLRLHYQMIGRGKDVVVIPSDVSWWTRADGLASARTVVLYDPRGQGRSDEMKDPSLAGMDYEIRDLEALRRHLSIDKVSLVGWSYLGAVVVLYAAQHPERVSAVVQVGAMPLRKGPHWDAYLKNLQARRDAAAEEKLAQMRKDGVPERDPVGYCKAFWESAALTMLAKPDLTGILPPGLCDLPNMRPTGHSFSVVGQLIEGLGDWDWTAQAGAVRARVLTVHGARDTVPPRVVARLGAGPAERAPARVRLVGPHALRRAAVGVHAGRRHVPEGRLARGLGGTSFFRVAMTKGRADLFQGWTAVPSNSSQCQPTLTGSLSRSDLSPAGAA